MNVHVKQLSRRTKEGFSQAVKVGLFACLMCFYQAVIAAVPQYGSPLRPFSKDSPWNVRPLNPKLGVATIPKANYFPSIVDGKYSVGVFIAAPTDEPEVIYMSEGSKGILIADEEVRKSSIVIPRWPRGTFPAEGADGHADIVDPQTGVIHSLYQLKKQDGRWRASLYSWARLDGRGWGDPAHFYQGARAVGVPPMAGLIRAHEVDDGEPTYLHALAVSLTFNGLSASPAYVYPATSADHDAATTNTGSIPQGALLMLPAEYDTRRIKNKNIRKIADTLKIFGAYVVDRNHGTPFAIYAEIGSLARPAFSGWDADTAIELDRMRKELRVVESAEAWLDADGQRVERKTNFNIMSMRGPWESLSGGGLGVYDMFEQRLVFDRPATKVIQVNKSGRSIHNVTWATPKVGESFVFSVSASEGATLRLRLISQQGGVLSDSGELVGGDRFKFIWPESVGKIELRAASGAPQTISSVAGKLIRLETDRSGL